MAWKRGQDGRNAGRGTETSSRGRPSKEKYILGILRITLSLILLWAFFDKLFGLGFATSPDKSWLAGNSPTSGFLLNAAHGPFKAFYSGLAGNVVVDWLFMLGLLLIGVSLFLGIGVRIAGYSGALLMFLMWTSLLPPANHPFIDEHIIYLFLFLLLGSSKSGRYLGFGKWWQRTALVRRYPILK